MQSYHAALPRSLTGWWLDLAPSLRRGPVKIIALNDGEYYSGAIRAEEQLFMVGCLDAWNAYVGSARRVYGHPNKFLLWIVDSTWAAGRRRSTVIL